MRLAQSVSGSVHPCFRFLRLACASKSPGNVTEAPTLIHSCFQIPAWSSCPDF
ncbi:hypothetical protein LEMLEM_LOCUS12116, partial [Lemmus lemmus]